MRVVLQCLRRNAACNCYDGAIAGLVLGELSDRVVSEIVKAEASQRALDLFDVLAALLVGTGLGRVLLSPACRAHYQFRQFPPWRSPALLGSHTIKMRGFTSRE